MLLLQIAEVNHEQVNSDKQERYHDTHPGNDIVASFPQAHSGSSRENQKARMPKGQVMPPTIRSPELMPRLFTVQRTTANEKGLQ